jgi:hypothetical protein
VERKGGEAAVILLKFLYIKRIKGRLKKTALFYQWLRQESNLHLKFRKLPFYPLNYGAWIFGDGKNTVFSGI